MAFGRTLRDGMGNQYTRIPGARGITKAQRDARMDAERIAATERMHRAELAAGRYSRADAASAPAPGDPQARRLQDALKVATSSIGFGHKVDMGWLHNMYGPEIAGQVASKINSGSMVNSGGYSAMARNAETGPAGVSSPAATTPAVSPPAVAAKSDPKKIYASKDGKSFGYDSNIGSEYTLGGA